MLTLYTCHSSYSLKQGTRIIVCFHRCASFGRPTSKISPLPMSDPWSGHTAIYQHAPVTTITLVHHHLFSDRWEFCWCPPIVYQRWNLDDDDDDVGGEFNARYNRLIESMEEGLSMVCLPSFLWLYLRADVWGTSKTNSSYLTMTRAVHFRLRYVSFTRCV